MTVRPRLLVAIVVYLSLDVALPSMPGAFVFAVADSVETVQRTRTRGAEGVPVALAPTLYLPSVPARLTGIRREPGPTRDVPRVSPRVSKPSRAPAPEPAASSEDPH